MAETAKRHATPYLVLIGDLVASRQADDRAALQRTLGAALADANRAGAGRLVSPWTITLGDEFQAVYGGPAGVLRDLVGLQAALLPARVRFAIGIGPMATPINPDQALGMDGPAFYAARDGIEALKESGRSLAVAGNLDSGDARWAAALLAVVDALSRKWRPNRFEVLYRLLGDEPVADIAAALDLSVQAVYRNIRDGELELVMELLALLGELLNRPFET